MRTASLKDFIKNFARESDGAWRCIASCEISHVLGRIQVTEGARFTPGTICMAVDIVGLLEGERERQERPPIHKLHKRGAGGSKVDATAETIRAEIQRRIRERARDNCRDCSAPIPVPSGLNAYGSHWSVRTMQGTPMHCLIFILSVVGDVMAEYELVGSQ